MGEFFKGWRRKIGVVMLVIACVFMALWVRSVGTTDWLSLAERGARSPLKIISAKSSIAVLPMKFPNSIEAIQAFGFRFPRLESREATSIESQPGNWFNWHWKQRGFGFATEKEFGSYRYFLFMVPYWSIVAPITLLSAYLLLVKPRVAKSKSTVDPTAAEGT